MQDTLVRPFRVFIISFFFCMIVSSIALAAEFSADFVVQAKGEGEMVGKIFVKDQKIRQEITEEGELQIMILRPDKSLTWMITPSEKVYMEIPYQTNNEAFEQWSPEKEKDAKYIGQETISGLVCKKYEEGEGEDKTTIWVSEKFSFPIKVEDVDTIVEYRNIKEGSVADSQFELPSGHKKMEMPMMPGAGGPEE